MTVRCTYLDPFFDDELDADQATAFRDHLPTCERCQRVLHGRMQEEVAAQAHDAARPADALPIATVRAAPVAAANASAASTPAASAPAASTLAASAPAASTASVPVASTSSDRMRGPGSGRRVLVYLAPVLAAAATVPLLCLGKQDGPLAMELEIMHGGKATRAEHTRGFAGVGDVLRPMVRGERHRALWVYLDGRDLLVACPNDERCTQRGGELAVEVKLPARGHYTIVALGSDDVIPAPIPGEKLDNVLAKRPAGVHIESSTVDVD